MKVPHEALRQLVAIEDYEGEGAYGATFETSREVRASVQHTEAFVTTWKNEEVTVDTLIIVRPEAGPIEVGSRLTIGENIYRAVKSFPVPDSHSPSHWEIRAATWGVE